MTADAQLYVVDSDVFITAKNRYYAFDICPGFWKSVVRRHLEGRLYSIDRVKNELLAGRKTEDLVVWAKNDVPDVCNQFGVAYRDTFQMLRDLVVRFDWAENIRIPVPNSE